MSGYINGLHNSAMEHSCPNPKNFLLVLAGVLAVYGLASLQADAELQISGKNLKYNAAKTEVILSHDLLEQAASSQTLTLMFSGAFYPNRWVNIELPLLTNMGFGRNDQCLCGTQALSSAGGTSPRRWWTKTAIQRAGPWLHGGPGTFPDLEDACGPRTARATSGWLCPRISLIGSAADAWVVS